MKNALCLMNMTMRTENMTKEMVIMRIAMKMWVTLEDSELSSYKLKSSPGNFVETSCRKSSRTASLLLVPSISRGKLFSTHNFYVHQHKLKIEKIFHLMLPELSLLSSGQNLTRQLVNFQSEFQQILNLWWLHFGKEN